MAVEKTSASDSLMEVLDRVLNKGIVIERRDVFLSLLCTEFLVLEERAAIISTDRYLQYAEAVGLLPSERPLRVTDYASRDRPRADIP